MVRSLHLLAAGCLTATLAVPAALAAPPEKSGSNTPWKKTVLDTKFRSEGVAVADVNKDGKIDVLNGEYWYEAPDWKPHEMQPFKDHAKITDNGMKGYSRVFFCWPEDLNGDGYTDLVVIAFPGEPCYWMENPKGKDGHWAKHEIWHSACNETPIYADLLGNGKKVLVMGFQPPGKGNEGQMAYFTPDPKNPNAKWMMHPISPPSTPAKVANGKEVPGTRKEIPGTQRFSHGLGVGDLNGDGRKDVICTGGWWEQPAKPDGKTPWTFHPANLGPACADMYVWDMDGDGKNDVISTSAHQFGIWWHKQRADGSFQQIPLFPKMISETHAAHFKDIDGDGRPDLITGKRWWSHGRSEPGADGPAVTYWFKNTKGPDGITMFTPVLIDDDCGVGTQFAVEDINGDGRLDVIVSNKKGVRVVVQERK